MAYINAGEKKKRIKRITTDWNMEDKKKKVTIDIKVEGKTGIIDFNELKSGGFIKQRQKDKFTVRCRVPGGRLPIEKLKKIAEVAERYGKDYVHFSVRQSIEIPYVDYKDFNEAVKELKEVNQLVASCGARVRVPTACSGCEYNPKGLIPTQELAEMVDKKFFGLQTNHKFKMGFSGCPIDCMRTTESDLGFQGAIYPEWNKDKCTGCTICSIACLEGAITPEPESGRPIFDESKCLYCADCIRACPTKAWVEGKVGCIIRIGGRHGRHPIQGTVVAKLVNIEDIPAVIEKTLEWYKKVGEGKGRVRTGQLIMEVGIDNYMEFMKDVFGKNAVENPKSPVSLDEEIGTIKTKGGI